MKRKLAVLLTAMALAGWTYAQDAEDKKDKQDQQQQKAEAAKQAPTHNQTDQDKDTNQNTGRRHDHITITSGPTVEPQDTSATIQWKTNKKATTFVRYGTDANKLDQKQWQKGGRTNHMVTLPQLQPGTRYYFAIMTDDDKIRTEGQFETTGQTAAAQNPEEPTVSQPAQTSATQPPAAAAAQAPPAPPAPASSLTIVKGPAIEFVTPNAVVIDWSTNARSSSMVHYGTDKNNLDQTEQAPWGSSFHRVVIQNLQPNTTYYFVVESSQAEGTGSGNKSTIAGFQTPAPGSQAQYNPPVIH